MSKITLEPVTGANYKQLAALSVADDQKNFVAPNWRTLLEAAYETELHVLAIYQNGRPVGLILYDFDTDMGGWTLSRFMIDRAYQQRGLGSSALTAFLEFFDNQYPSERLYTSAELDNPVAQKLYEKFGFEKCGEFSYENKGMTFHEVKLQRVPKEKQDDN